MNKRLGWVMGCALVGLLVGCASSNGNNNSNEDAVAEVGKIALPLVTHGPSGAAYRLRNATFEIVPYQTYWTTGTYVGSGGAATSMGGSNAVGTSPGTRPVVLVNGEDSPDSDSIQVDLEAGDYFIRLLSGWYLEKDEADGTATPVEAQLLSGETQWVWISPHSTSWVSYQFGLGDHALWFNGNLNVQINVYEDPSEYYGGGVGGSTGVGGYPGVGGATWVLGAGGAIVVPTPAGGSAGW